MRITLIVAMARNRVIGCRGRLPWHLPDDLRFFKRMTLGKPVIMGRRTFESVGSPLPGRRNIVLSRNEGFAPPGVVVARTPEEALAAAEGAEEVMICGGSAIYEAFLPRATGLCLTLVDADVEGETLFPSLDASEWIEISREEHPADERHAHPFAFLVMERKPRGSTES